MEKLNIKKMSCVLCPLEQDWVMIRKCMTSCFYYEESDPEVGIINCRFK